VRPEARGADEPDMRASHVATALAAFTAGLTAASALHRRAGRPSEAPVEAPATPDLDGTPDLDAVVLPFVRPVGAEQPAAHPAVADSAVESAAESGEPSVQPAAAARCGDSGGVTKAGAPCAARATSGGRCHRHPLAA
jgi:hypothetical protein